MSSPDPIARARLRLTGQFAALCAVLLIGAGGGVYLYVRHALLAAYDGAHDLAIRSVMENVDPRPTGLVVREKEFDEEFAELGPSLGVASAIVWSADGRKLARAGVDVAPTGPARELREEGAVVLLVRRLSVPDGQGQGTVVVARHAEDLVRDLGAFRRGFLGFAPAALVGSLVAGWIMAGRSLRPVRRSIEQQRTFMAEASHEIRTPLAVIRAQAEVPLEGESDVVAMRGSLGVIARTAAQLGGLVDDLLQLARADAEALAPRRVRFDLEEMMEETAEAFSAAAMAKGSRLIVRTEPPIELTADPAQLQRLLAILVDNALRHGVVGEIELSASRAGKAVELRVSDQGPGIPAATIPRMFERFVRGDAVRSESRGGHGLGLAIGRSIALAHGGTLELRPNAKGGITAIATIPLVA